MHLEFIYNRFNNNFVKITITAHWVKMTQSSNFNDFILKTNQVIKKILVVNDNYVYLSSSPPPTPESLKMLIFE